MSAPFGLIFYIIGCIFDKHFLWYPWSDKPVAYPQLAMVQPNVAMDE
jgi:hypothetical protein